MSRFTLACLIAALWAAFSFPAFGRMACPSQYPRDAALKRLHQLYRERPSAFGVQPDGSIVELTVSADGGTWSLLLITPGGKVCMITSGQHWTERKKGRDT